jgi:hypothetical protein
LAVLLFSNCTAIIGARRADRLRRPREKQDRCAAATLFGTVVRSLISSSGRGTLQM